MSTHDELPPLPESDGRNDIYGKTHEYYYEDSLRAYTAAAIETRLKYYKNELNACREALELELQRSRQLQKELHVLRIARCISKHLDSSPNQALTLEAAREIVGLMQQPDKL